MVRGELKPFKAQEDRTFGVIELEAVIDRLAPNQLVLEAQFRVTDSLKGAHGLADLEDGSAVEGGRRLDFEALRPDILQVRAPGGQARRIVRPCGALERIGPEDRRLGLRIVDIRISGEPSPAHFAELASTAWL